MGAQLTASAHWDLKFYYECIDLGSPDIECSKGGNTLKGCYDNDAQYLGMQANYKF